MKKTFVLMLGLVALFLTGCLVTSVAPFYSPKDIAFNSNLLGNWVNVSEKDERWEFEPNGTNAFFVTYITGDKTYAMRGCSFKFHGYEFLDLTSSELKDDVQPPPIPSHYLLRTLQSKPNLKLAPMDYDWLNELLAARPQEVAHHVIRNGAKPDDTRVVLTAETEKLQAFLARHLDTKEAWKQVIDLKKERAPEPIDK